MTKDKTIEVEESIPLPKLMKRERPVREYIFRGITKGSVGFIYGVPKSGKTTLCESLAKELISGGKTFMGSKLTGKKYKLLFISMEETWDNRVNRNEKQMSGIEESDLNNFYTNDENFPQMLSRDEDWGTLEKHIIESKPEIVFLDSMTRLCPYDIESSSTGSNIMGKIKKLSAKYNTTIVIIHHSVKPSEEKSLSYGSMAGTRVLSQEADFIIGVNKLSDGTRYIKDIMYRYQQESENVTGFEISENLLTVKTDEFNEFSHIKQLSRKSDGRRNETLELKILEYIEGQEGEVKRKEIDLALQVNQDKTIEKAVERALNALCNSKELLKLKRGVYKLPTKE